MRLFGKRTSGEVDIDGVAEVACTEHIDLLYSYVEALPFLAEIIESQENMRTLRIDLSKPRPAKDHVRITAVDDLIVHLNELAEKTFVPESEASRLAGAGAGISDND